MKRLKTIFLLLFALIAFVLPLSVSGSRAGLNLPYRPLDAFAQEEHPALPKLIVFFSPSCHKCMETKAKIMPRVEQEYKGRMEIEYRDISDVQNYSLMLALKEQARFSLELTLPVFYFQGQLFNGNSDILTSLRELIPRQGGPLWQALPQIDLFQRFKGMNFLLVAAAGLVDGINPCAFTVIVFFISFLSLQGYRKRELLAIGLFFIFAVFITYILIGLGLFNFLYRMKGFWAISRLFNNLVGIFSILMGGLAVYDFFSYLKTRKSEGQLLRLPQAVKNKIHSIIGLYYRRGTTAEAARPSVFKLGINALAAGFLVSLLEAVCTGQLYLPTITFVLKATPLKALAVFYFLLYNVLFVLPLAAIFLLALRGVTQAQFSDFLKKHLATVKLAMAAVFFSLGAVIIFWR